MAITLSKKQKSVTELELAFLKMLVTRLANHNVYLSPHDQEAITRFKAAHPQDSSRVEVKDLAVAEFLERNPSWEIGE